jgi:hypothetical protein
MSTAASTTVPIDDATYYAATDSGNLVCGPIAAEVADDRIFEQAQKKIETADEPVGRVSRRDCTSGFSQNSA